MTCFTKVAFPIENRTSCMEVWGGHGTTNNHFARPGLDIWSWSRSTGFVEAGGGELHLLSSCASGRITRLLLADVCGIGPLFTEIASEMRELMKRNINSIQQARIVRQMTSRLDAAAHHGGFASTLVCTYFAPTKSFTICNAGHPPPLLFRAQTQEWSLLKQCPTNTSTSAPRLGVVDPCEYQHIKTILANGDMVLSYSNALTECRDSQGSVIGLEGLIHRVQALGVKSPLLLPGRVIEHIGNEHADNLSKDDVTILLCQASTTPVAWRDHLLAPFRLFRMVSDKTRID